MLPVILMQLDGSHFESLVAREGPGTYEFLGILPRRHSFMALVLSLQAPSLPLGSPTGPPRSPASKPRAWAGLRLALAWLAGWLWLSACLLLRISAGFPLDSNSGLASAQDFMWISASGFHLYQDFEWILIGFGLI